MTTQGIWFFAWETITKEKKKKKKKVFIKFLKQRVQESRRKKKNISSDIWTSKSIISFDYILCSQRQRSSIQSATTRLGADCGSDHELLIAKFRLKLKKVGKTTRPFRCELNQIPYDYTVEVRKRFKGLDLIGRVPDVLWMEVCDIVQETGIKNIPKKKKCK